MPWPNSEPRVHLVLCRDVAFNVEPQEPKQEILIRSLRQDSFERWLRGNSYLRVIGSQSR
jgi:hypothetical protein